MDADFARETEWLGNDHVRLLSAVRMNHVRISGRKQRLLACACCRAIWNVMPDLRCRTAVELAEQAADESVPPQVLDQASGRAWEAFEELLQGTDAEPLACEAAAYVASHASNPDFVESGSLFEVITGVQPSGEGDGLIPSATIAALFRDILGNPFRPVAVEPGWLTSDVVAVARVVYAERAFDRLPVLADALQDAGCDHPDVLAHCRGPGPHARGCWVVDLILGKT